MLAPLCEQQLSSMFQTSKSPPGLQVSVVIPSHNEARRLGNTVSHVTDYLTGAGIEHEIVVVDDGSTDGTGQLVESLAMPHVVLVRHRRNQGKGAAVRSGILASRGAWILLTDADLSTPIEDLHLLTAHRDSTPVVVGSRAVAGARVEPRQPAIRNLLGKSYNRILRLLGLTRLHDTQCGFKLIRGDLGRQLAPEIRTNGFAFDIELLWLCHRSGASIKEVGVRWGHSSPSSVHVIRDSYRMLRDTLRLRRRILRRRDQDR